MPVAPTSIEAHTKLEETGEAQRQRDIVYAYILANHPRSGRETERDTNVQGAWRRLSELMDAKKIQHDKALRVCTVTGQEVIGWIPVGPDGAVYRRKSKLEAFGYVLELADGSLVLYDGKGAKAAAAETYAKDETIQNIYELKARCLSGAEVADILDV